MSTPIAIIASKGAVLEEDEVDLLLVVLVEVRSVVEEEVKRSVAEARRAPPVLEDVDWICEEAYMLCEIASLVHISQRSWCSGRPDRGAEDASYEWGLTAVRHMVVHSSLPRSAPRYSPP